ncbi:MAG: GNAT family N-acetyltransferase [Gemmatimonadetes bacterium]|nr:GNAT family N-acetyltransferase [Gemmatimonadota bacterium]MBT4612346.1 GNAT family N-acetyltransferase [Gemmatimonadota bacterium]MBT5059444.1 GNAT family N-acetyltransferase [Gemmatimonadota bacterium]MBT5146532.1 GNAT family N-acetyltransferase [Gemmatimonadota bacterium]MBT5591453.1 GNAT family N-acetyltransferase [Gemmatimonadota bacterium]
MPAPAELNIRPMTQVDILAVVTIITEFSVDDGRLAQDYYEQYFRSGGHGDEQNHVATIGEVVVGVTGLYPDKYDWPGILWLNWFYVSSSYRRRGIGGSLLDFTIKTAESLGCRKLYLDTSSDSDYAAAVAKYEKSGFVREGELRDYYAKGDHYLIYGLSLSADG